MAWAIRAGGPAERHGAFWFAWCLWYARGFPQAESDCMKLRSLGWDVLDQYKCGSANHGAYIHSHWSGERVGREAIPTYTDVLDWPQVLIEAVRNALCAGTFCHPIKHTALAWGLQFNKLNLHLKYTCWLGGTSEVCKLQVKTSIKHKVNENVFARSEKWKFGAGMDETMPTVAWWFAAHLGGC